MKKIHLVTSGNKFRCGKSKTQLSIGTPDFNTVTCKSCIEGYKYDKGLISEYTLGGDFGGDRKRRKISNHHDYKKIIKSLENQLEKAEKVIEFYGDKKAWCDEGRDRKRSRLTIHPVDWGKQGSWRTGGKKARQYFQDKKEQEGEK